MLNSLSMVCDLFAGAGAIFSRSRSGTTIGGLYRLYAEVSNVGWAGAR